jgi:hypothetical protein
MDQATFQIELRQGMIKASGVLEAFLSLIYLSRYFVGG